jgi:hypothetical protein
MNVMRAALVVFVGAIFAGLAAVPAWTQSAPALTPSPTGAKVYFINLKDGQEVTSPFLVQFGLSGMGVAPAGVEKPNTGHHHLLVDSSLSGDELKQPITMDDSHRHFGAGQTEALDHADSRETQVAARARRLVAYSALAAGDVRRDYGHGPVIRSAAWQLQWPLSTPQMS